MAFFGKKDSFREIDLQRIKALVPASITVGITASTQLPQLGETAPELTWLGRSVYRDDLTMLVSAASAGLGFLLIPTDQWTTSLVDEAKAIVMGRVMNAPGDEAQKSLLGWNTEKFTSWFLQANTLVAEIEERDRGLKPESMRNGLGLWIASTLLGRDLSDVEVVAVPSLGNLPVRFAVEWWA